jgi:hypothetical protein
MDITLGFTCDKPVDERQLRGLAATTFKFSDGTFRVAVPDILSRDCDRLIEVMAQDRIGVKAFNFALKLSTEAWQKPDSSWVGAVLLADELIDIDPSNVFDPVFPPPCYGLVPPSQPIRIAEEPAGHVVGVKHEKIFSAEICAYFESATAGTMGAVVLEGSVLPDWHRFFPSENRDVIATGALRLFSCQACHITGTGDVGVWLGRRDDFALCLNQTGIGHANAIHPYILGMDVAQSLEKTIGQGYGLAPIVDQGSQWGERVLSLLRQINSLRHPC